MNSYLKILYGAIREIIKERHPYDKDLIGIIAEMFLDFDREITVVTKRREE